MSTLRSRQSVAIAFGSVAVCELRSPGLGNRRNDLPGHAHPADVLVPGDLVGNHTEERCQRSGAAAGIGAGKLPDSLDLAA